MSKDTIVVTIKGLMPTANGCAIFLGNEEKTVLIYVDPFVGNAIQMTMSGEKKERPLTHELMGSMLLGLGVRLDHIVINDAKEGTFYARIILQMDNELGRKIVELDARPSDSIVLALQNNRDIYISRAVFDAEEDRTEFLENVLRQQNEAPDEDDDSI